MLKSKLFKFSFSFFFFNEKSKIKKKMILFFFSGNPVSVTMRVFMTYTGTGKASNITVNISTPDWVFILENTITIQQLGKYSLFLYSSPPPKKKGLIFKNPCVLFFRWKQYNSIYSTNHDFCDNHLYSKHTRNSDYC